MESPASITTENPKPQQLGGAGARGTLMAAVTGDIADAACSDERPYQDPWPSEAPPGEDAVSTPEEILSYWFPEGFDEADTETRRRQAKRWMAGDPEVDREISERTGETLLPLRSGEPSARRGSVD